MSQSRRSCLSSLQKPSSQQAQAVGGDLFRIQWLRTERKDMIEEFCAASPNCAANARNDAGLPMFLHRMWRRENHSWRAGKLARLCTLQWPNFSNRRFEVVCHLSWKLRTRKEVKPPGKWLE
eukprot:s63_g3.t1